MQGVADGLLTVLEGPVLLAYGAANLPFTAFQEGITGNWSGKTRYRKVKVRAERPDSSYTTSATARTDTTPFSEDFSLSGLGSFLFVQPLFAGAATSGTAEAFVNFQGWIESASQIVARQRFELAPEINATKTGIFTIGQPFPALGLQGVMVAAVVDVVGTVAFNFVERTFTADPRRPGSWGSNLLGSDQSYTDTNADYNSGDMAWAPSGAAFAQVGLKLPTYDATGAIDLILAGRYA